MNEIARIAPQTCCVIGNSFSLQKDHASALKFFRRATQLDPRFAYAHTLCGHELIAMDELDEATYSFHSAIESDPRHYNAWYGAVHACLRHHDYIWLIVADCIACRYGLGLVKMRQGQHKSATLHFVNAGKINPRSSVLKCYIGMVRLFFQTGSSAREAM